MIPVLQALDTTAHLVLRMGSVMFISLFGIELFMQMGLMKYLKPIGAPVAKLANLPSESALSFLAGIGSMVAAHTMTAQFHADHKLSDREVILTGVLNTVPFHFKETLTYQLPVVLPLLGAQLCIIYTAVFWMTGILKIVWVVLWGRFRLKPRTDAGDAFDSLECDPLDPACVRRSFFALLADTWAARKKMYLRMMTVLAGITLAVQLLVETGLLNWLEVLIRPLTSFFNLPGVVIGPVSAYVFSPTAGITFMSNLLNQQSVSQYQAIVSLMVASLLMIPLTRLRRTLPRYTALYGLKNGSLLCLLTTGFAMLTRGLVLIWILLFFNP